MKWLAAAVLGLAFSGAAAWIAWPRVERFTTYWLPPEAPADTPLTTPEEQQALRLFGRQVRGRLLWASNRGGNHDLYEADLQTGAVRALTSDPHVEFFGRYSPDGTEILYLRSRRPWVSFREIDGWDLYVMRADGTGARLVAEQAYHPAWVPGRRAISFLRDNRLMIADLAGGGEVLWHDGAAEPTRGQIGDPEPGPEGLFALSLRGVSRSRRGVGVLSRAEGRFDLVSDSPSACHVGWTPSGGLVWVTAEGHGGTRIMHARRPGADAEVLIDLPGAYSHEYFPRVSSDGAWLIWGAAADGHEHDRADYELFAWRIGAPWDQAHRLTYSAANDQWPDLRLD
ncbi:MAG TPA: hypothetical protein VIL25_10500 [Vicinamibacterales bacterium]